MPEQRMNQSQYEAVHFAEGALQLLAGPGSGKTFVITHRIRYLISEHGVPPEKILVITFTKAAAVEMQNRFKQLNGQAGGVLFGTFHAVFYQILRTLPEYQTISLISESEKLEMIDEILHQMHAEQYTRDQSYMGVLKQLSKYKNDPGASYELMEDLMEPAVFEQFKNLYQSMLQELHKLDFDDMVLLCYEALKDKRELLTYWQNRFAYILVDEFQDINTLQYEVVKLLAGKSHNLFVVGDDDQSIYGFRGAKPEIMQRFLKDFDGARQLCLTYNYRSREEIVKAADTIIRENRKRFDKKILAGRSSGGKVSVIVSDSTGQEMDRMVWQIHRLIDRGVPQSEIAVLLRTNREVHALLPYLERAGIPYAGYKMKNRIGEQSGMKVIMAYFAYLAGNHSRDNFYQFMNKPLRYLKRDAAAEPCVTEKTMQAYYRGNSRMQDAVTALFSDLSRMERMKPALALHYIRKVIGLDLYIRETEKEEHYTEYTDACELLKESIKDCKTAAEAIEKWQKIQADSYAQKQPEGIRVMTYHASKGLEFNAVFLPELTEGKLPPKQAKSADQIEEERRMFYVAVTRAKDRLHLYTVSNRKEEPSRFLKGIMGESL